MTIADWFIGPVLLMLAGGSWVLDAPGLTVLFTILLVLWLALLALIWWWGRKPPTFTPPTP